MNRRLQLFVQLSKCILFLCVILICAEMSALAQIPDSDCAELKDKWEQLYSEMKEKVDGFSAVEQTPIEQIIKKPLIDPNEHKTIAAQISEALKVTGYLLAGQRKELRNLLNTENKVFGELQRCLQMDKSAKRRMPEIYSKKEGPYLTK